MTVEAVIDRFENEAIDRRDLERAMRYNWLRNAYKMGVYDDDTAVNLLQMIHYLEPNQWPKPQYNGGQDNEKIHTDDRRERRIDGGSDEREVA